METLYISPSACEPSRCRSVLLYQVFYGLPKVQWQIQARLAGVYESPDEAAQARLAWAQAATIIQELAQGIKDETLRARFLAGPQIQPVLQHALGVASPVRQDHAEQQKW